MRSDFARALVVTLALAASCGPLPRRPPPPHVVPPEQTGRATVPDVALVTQDGRDVRFYDDLVRDRIVLINFMFARCRRYCPRTTANLVRVQQALGTRVGRDV